MKGVYVLILRLDRDKNITIGKLGSIHFKKGYYAYTGSALGTGGIKRVQRHFDVAAGQNSTRKWHIDYLMPHSEVLCAVFLPTSEALECAVAASLKFGGVPYFMTYIFISRQGQTTWNTDCADDADAHGYELPNPRISAQSAASAFPFRFDDYYFINPQQIKLIHRPRFSGHYLKFEGIPGFGCSDCTCGSHLFFSQEDFRQDIITTLNSLTGNESIIIHPHK